ncbi:hypothetical protein PIB30_034749 [Stylosanthes scabra]|uniref:Uncharacterized protein n=1 Tax=Stylosanthes scabra TaxID=79078 RepID=A0ABU6YBN7_9FABA|nr:hypothetical protein [Stylosanthes scabra]
MCSKTGPIVLNHGRFDLASPPYSRATAEPNAKRARSLSVSHSHSKRAKLNPRLEPPNLTFVIAASPLPPELRVRRRRHRISLARLVVNPVGFAVRRVRCIPRLCVAVIRLSQLRHRPRLKVGRC